MDKFYISTEPDGGCFQEQPSSIPSSTSRMLVDVNIALQDHLAQTFPKTLQGRPTNPSTTQGSTSAHTAFTNEAANNPRRNHFAQAPSLPPMQQPTRYPPSGPISEVPSQGWMAYPPYPRTATILHFQLPCREKASQVSKDTPVYVNAKQFNRILKRRDARQRFNKVLSSMPIGRKPCMHESRYRYSARRPKGPGGKLLGKN